MKNNKNIEKILNATDDKVLAKALQQYLSKQNITNKKGKNNGN